MSKKVRIDAAFEQDIAPHENDSPNRRADRIDNGGPGGCSAVGSEEAAQPVTLRAVIIGLVLGAAIAALGYFNDWVLNQPYVASDLAPVSVYGLLILGLLAVNPILRLARRVQLAASEWCVIVAMMLAACVIPSPGLMWNFANSISMPGGLRGTAE